MISSFFHLEKLSSKYSRIIPYYAPITGDRFSMLFFNVLLFAFFILIQIENILFFDNEIASLFGDKTFTFFFF